MDFLKNIMALPDLILIIEINYSQEWMLLKNDLLIIYVIKSFC
ncbi:hypothetical protein SK47_03219 [Enterobacter sp. BWH52]|nr:hypothetical protein SK47_03219 [Enterobacter sp. BWH52]